MHKMFGLAIAAAAFTLVYSEIESAAVISSTRTGNNIVIPNELKDFLIDFKHATSRDLLSSFTGDTMVNETTASDWARDWDTATTFMYKYKEAVLFELINIYPSLPDNEIKVIIHNAVMNVLEDHKTDERILMLFEIRREKHFNLRSHLHMLINCNPYLAIMNWVNDTTDNTIEENHNAQSGSERLHPAITNNSTDTLIVINQYPESYWASLLPETSESTLSIYSVMAPLAQRFLKFYRVIDFAKAIEFVETIPNDSIGNKVKKIVVYSALLSAAKPDIENLEIEVFPNYFDVALSFDEFSQNLSEENDNLNNLIKSVKDNYNGCYKSVMHSDNNIFMIKNEKYGEYLYTQPTISSRVFKSTPSDINKSIYTPIFTWRQANRTRGLKWEVKREKNLFWLKTIDREWYMDTTRCDHIHSTNRNISLPELAIKILPYSGYSEDTGLCRIMNVNTKQFLIAGDDDAAEDFQRRTIFCAESGRGLDNGVLNWLFEKSTNSV